MDMENWFKKEDAVENALNGFSPYFGSKNDSLFIY